MNRQIKFYRMRLYGVEREFIHPDNAGEAGIVRQLTGQKSIDGRIRELLRDFCGGLAWIEVCAPKKGGAQ